MVDVGVVLELVLVVLDVVLLRECYPKQLGLFLSKDPTTYAPHTHNICVKKEEEKRKKERRKTEKYFSEATLILYY